MTSLQKNVEHGSFSTMKLLACDEPNHIVTTMQMDSDKIVVGAKIWSLATGECLANMNVGKRILTGKISGNNRTYPDAIVSMHYDDTSNLFVAAAGTVVSIWEVSCQDRHGQSKYGRLLRELESDTEITTRVWLDERRVVSASGRGQRQWVDIHDFGELIEEMPSDEEASTFARL
ncbi:hypothetical protein HDU97_007352 [Phlyctochytrium planicorne]|nr:hypothetical protein HDU97_007352 [Phlyctochytrium planicorne]